MPLSFNVLPGRSSVVARINSMNNNPHLQRRQQKYSVCLWRLCFFAVAIGIAVPTIWFLPHSINLNSASILMVDLGLSSISTATTTNNKNNRFDDDDIAMEAEGEYNVANRIRSNDWKGYQRDRQIAFVHVGKSGGLTVRRVTSLICRLSVKGRNQTELELLPCLMRNFQPNATLSRQVKYYFHMHAHHPHELEQATDFLFVLRNPIDRVISSYRYSHPANCLEHHRDKSHPNFKRGAVVPWGCQIWDKATTWPNSTEYRLYRRCFPSAGMEQFAQSILSPFTDFQEVQNNTLSTGPLTIGQANICRSMAHRMVKGFGPGRPSPHMYYNYGYYKKRTLDAHPEKVVLGIRTENEWEDLQALDQSIGGTGQFAKQWQGRAVSHGSESYEPSPLSTEAYEKLCCVLHEEIANYQTILKRVVNIDDTAKAESMLQVKQKCGIDASTPLRVWRQACFNRLQKDVMFFAKNLPNANAKTASATASSPTAHVKALPLASTTKKVTPPPEASAAAARISQRQKERLQLLQQMRQQPKQLQQIRQPKTPMRPDSVFPDGETFEHKLRQRLNVSRANDLVLPNAVVTHAQRRARTFHQAVVRPNE